MDGTNGLKAAKGTEGSKVFINASCRYCGADGSINHFAHKCAECKVCDRIHAKAALKTCPPHLVCQCATEIPAANAKIDAQHAEFRRKHGLQPGEEFFTIGGSMLRPIELDMNVKVMLTLHFDVKAGDDHKLRVLNEVMHDIQQGHTKRHPDHFLSFSVEFVE